MFLLLHGLMDRVCNYSKQELVRQFYRLEIKNYSTLIGLFEQNVIITECFYIGIHCNAQK